MTQVKLKNVGVFFVLPAPLNPIGAFDAEKFKANFRSFVDSNAGVQFVAVDLSGLDFVYSDAYNAFMQFHQELSNKGGLFAVLASKESLASSLRKVGLERFIRIFLNEESMAAYVPVRSQTTSLKTTKAGADVAAAAQVAPVKAPVRPSPVREPVKPAPQARPVQAPPEVKTPVVQPKILDKNPLVDEEPSSKGTVITLIVLLLIAIAVVVYFVM